MERCRDKNIDKGELFQAGDSSTQQLYQKSKLKLNNCVSLSFVCRFKGSWVGAGSAASPGAYGVAKATGDKYVLEIGCDMKENWRVKGTICFVAAWNFSHSPFRAAFA